MSFTLLASIVLLVVLLLVVPTVMVLRDLRAGRADPAWRDGS